MDSNVFRGCIPAIMTPCHADRSPNYAALVRKAQELISVGMNAVVYCGSMGDWPLLTNEQRQEGVRQLAEAGATRTHTAAASFTHEGTQPAASS